jgi:signal transduction histidine kinase
MMQVMPWPYFNHTRLLRYAAFFVYICVGLPLSTNWAVQRLHVLGQPEERSLILWTVCYLVFGIVYWLLTRNLGSRINWSTKLAGLLTLTATAVAIGWLSKSGLAALLLVIIAAIVPWLVRVPIGIVWMVAANFALVPLFRDILNLGWFGALLQSCIYFGFCALIFVTSTVASQQAEEREEQRRLNSELRATRALLAESSRIAERMRIARDLHDLVGHHLTALSLNLEVASHLTNEASAVHVRKAQMTAKHLLADVREVVSELRQDDAIDLTQALRSLIEGVPGLQVHLEIPPRFGVEDPRRAQMLLRCVQEILTNTARHADARHLWLRFTYTASGALCLEARDDGRGSAHFVPGNGLNGMRERLAEFDGTVDFGAHPKGGFAITARLPAGEESTLAHAPARPALDTSLPEAT